jgi:eukaryotic-like serine/threonine-protein kinase
VQEPTRYVGRYEIVREIGRGGAAVVYLARQTDLDRYVALKQLSSAAANPAFARRFLVESRVVGSLSHPNIVTTHDFFEHDGVPWIAMEYLERGSLRPLVGRLELAQVGGVLEATLAGLAHAHGHGVVHRDIKPENLLLTSEGIVKISDFGIAKAINVASHAEMLTATGTTIGTPTYMAPEQAMGKDVGPWTDLYAVGALAFELLTGRPPFDPRDDDSPMATLYRQVTEPAPRLRTLVPDAGERLDGWVDSILAKTPESRPASALEAWSSLEEILIEQLGPRWRRSTEVSPEPGESAPLPAGPPLLVVPQVSEAEAEPERETSVFPRPAPTSPAVPAPPPPPAPPPQPFVEARPEDGRGVCIPLSERFRYVHEPLLASDDAIPFLGNDAAIAAMKERILHSSGGSFLVTGFRGVGKTTLVARVLEELAAAQDPDVALLPIWLRVARPTTTDELLFEVIRRLFEALVDEGVFERLAPHVQRALLVSYARTSLSFRETRSQSSERTRSLGLGGPAGGSLPAASAFNVLAPKFGYSKKNTNSIAREAAFLAYSNADVEHDFLRIVDLLRRPAALQPRGVRRVAVRLGLSGRDPPCWSGRLIVVIDELDKLTATEAGIEALDELLSGLKNLLTTRGAYFLFVGGPDLHDAALRYKHRGSSVYESIFGWQAYVSCIWGASERLLDELVGDVDGSRADVDALRSYLAFKARGIPRLLLLEFNELVRWDGAAPYLELGADELERIYFYARLEEILRELRQKASGDRLLSLPIDEDRLRLSIYYVTDWVLRSGGREFTAAAIAEGGEAAMDPLLRVSEQRVERVLAHLAANGILEELRGSGSNRTIIGDVKEAQASVYRLSASIHSMLSDFARMNDRERVNQLVTDSRALPAMPFYGTVSALPPLPQLAVDDRYELLEEIGRGSMGTVFRARDRLTEREVAVRLLPEHLRSNEIMQARLQREGDIAVALRHRNIAETYGLLRDGDAVVGIVTELVLGRSVRVAIDEHALEPPTVVTLALQLLDALEYLAGCGVHRLDLKPANLILDGDRIVIADLALAKSDAAPALTAVNVVVGTPASLAPELIEGHDGDIRSDVYSLGLVLAEMLAGGPLPRDADAAELDGNFSPALRDVVARALARRVEARFQSPTEMRVALAATPEAQGADD